MPGEVIKKKWYRSRSVWTAIIGVGVAIAIEGNAPAAGVSLSMFSGLQGVLRALTSEGIVV